MSEFVGPHWFQMAELWPACPLLSYSRLRCIVPLLVVLPPSSSSPPLSAVPGATSPRPFESSAIATWMT